MTGKDKGMAAPDDIGASRLWRLLRIGALGLAICFLVGVGAGFIVASLKHGDGPNLKAAIALGAIALALGGSGWLMVREIRKPTGEEPATPRERVNRNIIIGCALLGFVTAVIMMSAGGKGVLVGSGEVFSNEPLPRGVAIVLVLIAGVIVPAVSLYWHRVIDEQEADAYRSGAVAALYVYAIGAPTWWLAWRGGFAPEPNGFIIYYAVATTVCAVWLWKKYR